MKNNMFSKQYMNKHYKYQRSSLNIIILNVRSNVLFSKFIDVALKIKLLPNEFKLHTCKRVHIHSPRVSLLKVQL